jgi:hypothetical protein
MIRSFSARFLAAACVSATVAAGVTAGQSAASVSLHTSAYSLAAFTQPAPATVLTLEGGLVGLIPGLRITQSQLRGDLCAAPNTCRPVDYSAIPLGPMFNDQGAVPLNAAIAADTPTVLYGHSQGGQVIYSALRGWAAAPSTAPDPAQVSWVSIGNPENTFGGQSPNPIPVESPYRGTEVIRQYDGWADWPTDTTNTLAVLNAVVGMQTVHPDYFTVDVDDPDNLRHVEGNVTYVFVPNKTLPLVQLAGPLAPLINPVLDPILRPMVESGYSRPGGVASPLATATALPASAAAKVPPPVSSVVELALMDRVTSPVATGAVVDTTDRPARKPAATERRTAVSRSATPSRQSEGRQHRSGSRGR